MQARVCLGQPHLHTHGCGLSHGCAGDVHASRWVALRVRVRLAGPRRASGSAWDRFSESFSVWSDDAKRKVRCGMRWLLKNRGMSRSGG